MKLGKYYTLYECTNTEEVWNYLNGLQESGKIEYEMLDTSEYEVFKISDISLSDPEIKNLLGFFSKNEVSEYEWVSEEISHPYDDEDMDMGDSSDDETFSDADDDNWDNW
jgi:hypothetical protein